MLSQEKMSENLSFNFFETLGFIAFVFAVL